MEQTLKGDFAEILRFAVARATKPTTLPYHGIVVPVGATPELGSLTRKLLRGLHECYEIAAVNALLQSGDVVLEIGAGTGVLSTIMAKRGARVHSFEGNSKLAASAAALFAANEVAVDYRSMVVGTTAGTATFYIGSKSKSGGGASLIDRGNTVKIEAPMLALDRLLAELRPTFLMMDAEGAEKDLLAAALPSHVRAICAEIHPHVIGDEACTDIVRNLIAQGFTLHVDQTGGRVFAFSRQRAA